MLHLIKFFFFGGILRFIRHNRELECGDEFHARLNERDVIFTGKYANLSFKMIDKVGYFTKYSIITYFEFMMYYVNLPIKSFLEYLSEVRIDWYVIGYVIGHSMCLYF